ncbi:MAG: PspA/IM30 family protein [Anaerolinea sp.]|mgnify:CR=1 FL=1|nr:PspA/IM30 family protein [Anaerolinea sp.]
MAPSLIEKVNTLINASLHGMVDRALSQNSVAVMDEYIRQAEKNLEALEDSAATVGGTVRTLKRKYDEFAAAAEKLDRDIDTLVLKGKNDLAAAAQAELNTKQQLAQEYFEQWQTQDQQYNAMLDMRMKLEARLTTIRQEREQLRALIELAAAKKVATNTIKSLDDLAKVGDKEISSFADQVRNRLDTEDARLEMATRNLQDQIDDAVRSGEIDRQLEERRRRLLGAQGGGDGGAAASSGAASSDNA